MIVVFVQAEDGIRDLVRSRGLGDVYKRQVHPRADNLLLNRELVRLALILAVRFSFQPADRMQCLLELSLIHI